MGGCCCCCSKGTELNSVPAYYYQCPRVSEEHLPLSSQHGTAAALSTGFLVDLNLDTSIPDNYRPPPAPTPYDVVLGRPRTPPTAQAICPSKNNAAVQPTNSDCVQETVGCNAQETSPKCDDVKESDCKLQAKLDFDSVKESEIELSKSKNSDVLAIEEEDVCPICLEEYDAENPKITTKCEHHFHLACILEWMERSETCPVCDQEMIFDPPIDY